MPEIITTPNALVQTNNGKRFYVNSGIVSVASSEITLVDIANVGERDLFFSINVILTSAGSDNMTMKLKNNGIVIYQSVYNTQDAMNMVAPLNFIIPSNTSIIITFQNQDGSSHDVGVSCYGKFV